MATDPNASENPTTPEGDSDTSANEGTAATSPVDASPADASTTGTSTAGTSPDYSLPAPPPAKSSNAAWAIVVALLSVAVVVAAGLAVFFGVKYAGDDDGSAGVSQEVRTQALDTARDYSIKLSSFDYRDLDKNRESITAMSTEDFAKKYDEMVTALTQIVTDGKGEATAEVTHSAIESINGEKATVILFVDQTAKNVVSPEGRVQPYRMVVTLERSDDKWLVDNVETK